MRRLLFVILVSVIVSCTHTVKEGERVVVGDGDTVVVGNVHINVASNDDSRFLQLTDGVQTATRRVSGLREVKFGAHRVRFEETGSQVAIVVRAFKPASPLTSVDALFVADEAAGARTVGMSDCKTATLSADGKSYVVACTDTDAPTSTWSVTVDAVTGAVTSFL